MQINSIINSQILINSPLEQFEVTSLLGINAPIFGYINLTLYSILVLFIVLSLHYVGNNDNKLLLSRRSILLFILIFGFMFLFLSNSSWENFFKNLLSFITSFIVFYFVFNKFKYSNNLIISFIQKFFIYNICFIFAVSLASYFDFYFFKTIYCDPTY